MQYRVLKVRTLPRLLDLPIRERSVDIPVPLRKGADIQTFLVEQGVIPESAVLSLWNLDRSHSTT